MRYLVTNPLWLFGWVALAAAFVFQALALHNGNMSVVQPLLVTELVFALVLRWLWIHQGIRAVTWWAAALDLRHPRPLRRDVGAHRRHGRSHRRPPGCRPSSRPPPRRRRLALLGARGSPARRAACLGAATSVLWALVATFIKATTDSLTQFGLGGMFTHWPVYALAATGLTAELLNQAALHVGPLSVSQPLIVIVDPIVSIALSVWVYGETFTADMPRLFVGALSFAGMCVAATVLARTAPATMDSGVTAAASP